MEKDQETDLEIISREHQIPENINTNKKAVIMGLRIEAGMQMLEEEKRQGIRSKCGYLAVVF